MAVSLPEDLKDYPKADIEQFYISFEPVIRLRKKNDKYFLTCKSTGRLVREEIEMEVDRSAFERLKIKAEGNIIKKSRYIVPADACGIPVQPDAGGIYQLEIDVFRGNLKGLHYIEIEFSTLEEAERFEAPSWFGKEVTELKGYSNVELALSTGLPE